MSERWMKATDIDRGGQHIVDVRGASANMEFMCGCHEESEYLEVSYDGDEVRCDYCGRRYRLVLHIETRKS